MDTLRQLQAKALALLSLDPCCDRGGMHGFGGHQSSANRKASMFEASLTLRQKFQAHALLFSSLGLEGNTHTLGTDQTLMYLPVLSQEL